MRLLFQSKKDIHNQEINEKNFKNTPESKICYSKLSVVYFDQRTHAWSKTMKNIGKWWKKYLFHHAHERLMWDSYVWIIFESFFKEGLVTELCSMFKTNDQIAMQKLSQWNLPKHYCTLVGGDMNCCSMNCVP